MNWWKIGLQEINDILRKYPKLILGVFISPLVYVFLFGMFYGNHVINNVPLVVYDESQTQLSRRLVQVFEDSERFRVVAHVNSQKQMEEYLNEKKAYAALAIPERFAREVKAGVSSQVLVESNGSNLTMNNTILIAAQEIVHAFSDNTAATLLETTGQTPALASGKTAPVRIRTRVLNNPTLSYQLYFVFGLALTSFHTALFIGAAGTMIMEYKMRKYNSTHPFHVLVGKLFPFWLGGILAYAVILCFAVIAFGLPFKGSITELLLLGSAFVFAITSCGSLVVAFFDNFVSFFQLAVACSVPVSIISGLTWPLASMPPLIQAVAHLLPFTFFCVNVRSLMITGHAPYLYNYFAILMLYGAVLLGSSLFVFSRRRNKSSDQDRR